jgi:hypothetical protein
LECFGHPCQKQPSTKTATRSFRNTKSGRVVVGRVAPRGDPALLSPLSASRFPPATLTATCRRHPVTPFARRSLARAISVSLLPRPRIRQP